MFNPAPRLRRGLLTAITSIGLSATPALALEVGEITYTISFTEKARDIMLRHGEWGLLRILYEADYKVMPEENVPGPLLLGLDTHVISPALTHEFQLSGPMPSPAWENAKEPFYQITVLSANMASEYNILTCDIATGSLAEDASHDIQCDILGDESEIDFFVWDDH